MTDDLGLSNTETMDYPGQETQEERDFKTKAAQSYPVIKDLLEYLDESIERYKSVESIPDTFNAEQHMVSVKVNKALVTELNVMRGYVDSMKQKKEE